MWKLHVVTPKGRAKAFMMCRGAHLCASIPELEGYTGTALPMFLLRWSQPSIRRHSKCIFGQYLGHVQYEELLLGTYSVGENSIKLIFVKAWNDLRILQFLKSKIWCVYKYIYSIFHFGISVERISLMTSETLPTWILQVPCIKWVLSRNLYMHLLDGQMMFQTSWQWGFVEFITSLSYPIVS